MRTAAPPPEASGIPPPPLSPLLVAHEKPLVDISHGGSTGIVGPRHAAARESTDFTTASTGIPPPGRQHPRCDPARPGAEDAALTRLVDEPEHSPPGTTLGVRIGTSRRPAGGPTRLRMKISMNASDSTTSKDRRAAAEAPGARPAPHDVVMVLLGDSGRRSKTPPLEEGNNRAVSDERLDDRQILPSSTSERPDAVAESAPALPLTPDLYWHTVDEDLRWGFPRGPPEATDGVPLTRILKSAHPPSWTADGERSKATTGTLSPAAPPG
jgi:hypothetical protein